MSYTIILLGWWYATLFVDDNYWTVLWSLTYALLIYVVLTYQKFLLKIWAHYEPEIERNMVCFIKHPKNPICKLYSQTVVCNVMIVVITVLTDIVTNAINVFFFKFISVTKKMDKKCFISNISHKSSHENTWWLNHISHVVATLSKYPFLVENDFLYSIGCQVYCTTDGDVSMSKIQSESRKNGNFCDEVLNCTYLSELLFNLCAPILKWI